jgi:antitoxin MazE
VITKVQRWGNSQGLRLSKELLAQVDINVGETVQVVARDGALIITPARRVRGALDLAELVSGIPRDYHPSEVEWGPAAGDEVW